MFQKCASFHLSPYPWAYNFLCAPSSPPSGALSHNAAALHRPHLIVPSVFPHILQAMISTLVLGPTLFDLGLLLQLRPLSLELAVVSGFRIRPSIYGINPYSNKRILHILKSKHRGLQGRHSRRATIFAEVFELARQAASCYFMIGCNVFITDYFRAA